MSILTRFVSPRAFMVSPHDHHPGQFAMSAGGRLKRNGGETLNSFSHSCRSIHQRQVPLDSLDRLERMCEGKSGQPGGVFIDLGVVFHRT